MTTYISILRGINVSGQRKIKMADLKEVYVSLGFQKVETYIQSGNVIFCCEQADEKKLVQKIELAIRTVFGFDVPVQVLELSKLKKVYAGNPFVNDRHKDISVLHVTFLAHEPDSDLLKRIETDPKSADEFIVAGTVIYLFCPNGYGRTKLTNTFFETKLKIRATTRNWKTVTKLVELASATA